MWGSFHTCTSGAANPYPSPLWTDVPNSKWGLIIFNGKEPPGQHISNTEWFDLESRTIWGQATPFEYRSAANHSISLIFNHYMWFVSSQCANEMARTWIERLRSDEHNTFLKSENRSGISLAKGSWPLWPLYFFEKSGFIPDSSMVFIKVALATHPV